MSAANHARGGINQLPILTNFLSVRAHSLAICSLLEAEDFMLQAMPDVSPPKWHLAHTTWFFERFVLSTCSWYKIFRPEYDFLFNSYYRTAGTFHKRPERGLLSRPASSEIFAYRAYVDQAMTYLLSEARESFNEVEHSLESLLELGLNHEQQHQELLLTDIKYNFFSQPMAPALQERKLWRKSKTGAVHPMDWIRIEGGVYRIGSDSKDFAYDNEKPSHRVYIEDVALSSRLVSNEEYLRFVEEGGYRNVAIWLSEGWDWILNEAIAHPLYWRKHEDEWQEFTLHGWQAIDPAAPVSHINYFEANAFAHWAGFRLPTEAEWEVFARSHDSMDKTHDFDLSSLFPKAAGRHDLQLRTLWQWTSSSYGPYPGFVPLKGNLAEYNGTFMVNQYVLRGGSCATSPGHLRDSYRNFFPSGARWQFTGIRLAKEKDI
jgi:ergothioneine biosynthesis protein EgtB